MIVRLLVLSLLTASSSWASDFAVNCDVVAVVEENNIFEEGLGVKGSDADEDSVSVSFEDDNWGLSLRVGQMSFSEQNGDEFHQGAKIGFGENVTVARPGAGYRLRFTLDRVNQHGGKGAIYLIENGAEKLMAKLSCL